MVIGIIAIVLGALGILGGCWAGVAYPVMEAILSAAPKEAAAGLDLLREWWGWTLTMAIASSVLAVLLIFVLVGAAMAVMMQQTQVTAISGQGGAPATLPPGFTMLIGAVTGGFSVVWGWALPGFMIVWLSRGRIKREIAEWT